MSRWDMLDTTLILVFVIAIVFYWTGFNFPDSWKNYIVGSMFLGLGLILLSTGLQSSNTSLGTYQTTTDAVTGDYNVSFNPFTITGNITNTEVNTFDWGLFFISTFFLFGGAGIMLNDWRGRQGGSSNDTGGF